jgi:hypothetical protein
VGDLVPTVSVLSSAAVGLGGAVLAAVTTAKRERAQTKRDRENELRSVADQAATDLSYVIYLLKTAWDHPEDKKGLETLGEVIGRITNFEDRLAIRLGNDANQVVPYRQAVTHARAAQELIERGADAAQRGAFDDHRKGVADEKHNFRKHMSERLSPDGL